MAQERLVISVRKYLASHNMFADDEWISGLVEYLMENCNGDCKENEVQILAKEQWLLNDLKDMCPGCLPTNIKEHHKKTLYGNYVLQINASVDIGTPAYQQYLKLQKVNTENVEATINIEDKVPCHRMIKFYLTDGVQDVTAIEYRPMRNLSYDISPGGKLLLKGPVECRRGMFLLEESNVEFLGGEVKELAHTNALAGMLSAKLGLPPTVAQENMKSTNTVTSINTSRPPPSAENITPIHTRMPEIINEQASDLFVGNDDIDIEQIAAIEAQYMQNSGKRSLNDNNDRPEKKARTIALLVNNVDDYPDDVLEGLTMEDEEYIREMEAQIDAQEQGGNRYVNQGSILVPAEPFVYIKQINELTELNRAGKVFKVKGQIMKLLSKLSVGKDGWSLKCAIVDGTASMNVDFTSDVLSELVGITPTEMNQIKKQMATKPEIKEKAVTALQKAKETLQVLYCIIELTMLDGPKITRLIPFNGTHVGLLKKRQSFR